MERVLITGSTGSAGSYLCEYLKEKHPEVKVFGTSRTKRRDREISGVTYYPVHLGDFPEGRERDILGVIRDCRPDLVFHLAADADVRRSFDQPLKNLDNNIRGTWHLYEAIRQSGKKSRVMLASTP